VCRVVTALTLRPPIKGILLGTGNISKVQLIVSELLLTLEYYQVHKMRIRGIRRTIRRVRVLAIDIQSEFQFFGLLVDETHQGGCDSGGSD